MTASGDSAMSLRTAMSLKNPKKCSQWTCRNTERAPQYLALWGLRYESVFTIAGTPTGHPRYLALSQDHRLEC